LAVLHIDVDIDPNFLALSAVAPSPGETVFAIGNPEGLEKSISAGIVAANREIDGRSLIQITAPISHGSSGGPVLNSAGEVIGVSVGMLQEGQNLNFAIPIAKVKALLLSTGTSEPGVVSILEQVKKLKAEKTNQQDSAQQATEEQIVSLLQSAKARAGTNEKLLIEIAGEAQTEDVDLAVSAAEAAVALKSDTDSNFALGNALRCKALIEFFRSGEPQTGILQRAKMALEISVKQSRTPSSEMYFDVGDVLEDLGSYADAESNFLHALEASKRSFSQAAIEGSYRGLVRVTYSHKRFNESESWFKMLTDRNFANAWDWHAQGKHRFDTGKYSEAGDAYSIAASSGGDWTNLCLAANSYSVSDDDKKDAALSAARQCIAAGTGKEKSDVPIASAHFVIAQILNSRGVFAEALTHAREAADLDSSNAWSFQAEAEALVGLRRFAEAITAGDQAIRLSDGKYSLMHFTLGSAYFEEQNWEFARQSYQKAAELDPTDTAAPYNVALCMVHLGYRSDAVKWFNEVLRRDPQYTDRAEIRRRISTLTAGLNSLCALAPQHLLLICRAQLIE
jgi:tetratricopeptide (TPR) repeat protein